ncbi:putative ribonuclease H-like domain-containing protein [Tanacetum coccineum]
MWDAIKSRFSGNDELKKMQKYILKQQFEGFLVSNSEGLHKGFDRFQSLLSQLEIHGADEKAMCIILCCNNVAFVSCEHSAVSMIECRTKGFRDVGGRDAWNSGNKDGRRSAPLKEEKICFDGLFAYSQGSDREREQLSDASIEIKAYTQGLKNVEAQLVDHQQGQLEASKKKEDLKAKVEKWHNSSKNLGKLLNTQMSANDKFGLGYGDHRYDDILSYENEVLQSVFMNKESELVNQPLYDRLVIAEGMHVVPPPMTGNYMPSGPDQVKPPRETVKNQFTHSKNPTVDKKGLGYGFTTKACFVCGSLSHLIRDCDFHEKRMAKQAELNNRMSKKSSQREIRTIWNNVQRVNHKNQFVPTTVLTRTGKIPVSTARASGTNNVSTARHNFNSQAVLTNAARKISTVKPFVNRLVLLGGKGKLLLSPQQVVIGDQKDITGTKSPNTMVDQDLEIDYPHRTLQNKGIVDSGCSRHMTGNKAYLAEYQDFNGGPVAFGGSKGYITGKGKIKTGKLDFEDVCFVKELQHFNLFSVSQICDKKNKVLFTDSECLVLSPEFKLPDANQVLLRIPRQNNMYSFNLENIVPSGGLACLIAKATIDESNKWHRRLGHVNFKNLNKLVKGNLVRGLPSKIFQNDHTCVACQKGKQHKASCKAKSVSSISHSLQLLHMDLFGPTSVRSLNHKTYCLVITDDFSRFSWVFFLRTKDETSGILKDFIRQIENQLNQKVKTIRCDNGTEFKNRDFIEFCGSKGIKREYSNARTPQQNGVAERKNKEEIHRKANLAVFDLEYLTDSNELCSPMRTMNQATKHAAESAQDYFVLPIWSSYTSTVKSSEAKNEGEKSTKNTDLKTNEKPVDQEDQAFLDELERLKRQEKEANDAAEALRKEFAQNTEDLLLQAGAARASSTNTVNTASTPVSTASPSGGLSFTNLTNTDQDDSEIPDLEDSYDNPNDGIFTNASYDDEGAVADFTNLETINISEALEDESWKKAIGTKWVYRNKKDERGVVVRNKARLVAHGHRQEEGLDYDESGYRRGTIEKTLFIKKDQNDFMLVQVYVDDIIFGSTKTSWCDESEALMKSRSSDDTPVETQKPLVKDEEAADVDVHLYRSMIGSLMYLTASRPDIMFVVRACSRFPEWSSLTRSYSNSDSLEQILIGKSTTGEAKYVAAANCCGQVLLDQNQMLDYGFNFMNTKIYIDNESTICIVKNPVFHSKTKHIEIRHHLIRDAYEKKLIQVLKIHTDDNVVDLLAKAFDVSRFNFLIVNIGMINQ